MRMNRIAALTLGAGMLTMAACSDSPTAPAKKSILVPKTSFAVGDVTNSVTPIVGKIFVCKTGNVGGSFTFTREDVGPEVDENAAVASNQTIANGTCLEVANDFSPSESGSNITVTEGAAPANTVQSVESCTFVGKDLQGGDVGPEPCETYTNGQTLFLNSFHGFVIVYNNVFTEPPPPVGCTYTKGWYQNKNGSKTIIADVLGLTIDEQFQIFSATPGKPGNVKWGVTGGTLNNKPNDALNLMQQLLAALNNLKNNPTGGPASVDAAIATATGAITVTGTTFTVAAGTDIGGLTSVLSSFNEGQLDRPHCD
jgi:hypothetical protein